MLTNYKPVYLYSERILEVMFIQTLNIKCGQSELPVARRSRIWEGRGSSVDLETCTLTEIIRYFLWPGQTSARMLQIATISFYIFPN